MIQQEGPGWRLARDPSRGIFSVLIGGEGWAIELTENEWESLVKVIRQLLDQYQQLQNTLMKEETITLELEQQQWWVCIDGNCSSWSLQVIFHGDCNQSRGFEAFWPTPASQAIATAMRKMWDSCQ